MGLCNILWKIQSQPRSFNLSIKNIIQFMSVNPYIYPLRYSLAAAVCCLYDTIYEQATSAVNYLEFQLVLVFT